MTPYKVACFGEILWDILPDKKLPGGAPMNVAYHLQQLSVPAAMISGIGRDKDGEALLQVMEHNGLSTAFIQTDEQHETGKVYAQETAVNEMAYDIVEPVAWDHIRLTPSLQELMKQPGYLVFGSLAARNTGTRETLLSLLESDRTFVLDINLRPPHYSKDLITELLQHCHILKLNEAELELTGNWYNLPASFEERVRAFSSRFNIPVIIITMGSKGAALFKDNTFYRHPGYPVTVADTIGSGDAFLAGFLYSTINGSNADSSLSFACAMGALIASRHGACPDYKVEQISELMQQTR